MTLSQFYKPTDSCIYLYLAQYPQHPFPKAIELFDKFRKLFVLYLVHPLDKCKNANFEELCAASICMCDIAKGSYPQGQNVGQMS